MSVSRKGVYLLPNLLTSATLFGGFYAIVAAFDGKYEYAAIAILISALFDGLDGRIARLTNTTSKFGAEYDSIADVVAFGLAPGILIFTWALRPYERYGWIAAFLYVVCGALRLARFNTQISTVEMKNFKGLPIPAAAALVASTVLLFYTLNIEVAKHITVLLLIYLLAYLMVSNIKYYSFKELNLSQRIPFSLLIAAIMLLLLVVAKPPMMLFILTLGYALSGPVAVLIKREKLKKMLERSREKKKIKKTLDT
ncbi:MAG: CDP-diacylglycerol--serine O-phosphatidyltransferase [Deltaproteobacteria bacterium]|nr:CDP-diacylglycerol--serine O-phosphatidyltransferase [Deltaproteobacteria bacterium]